ncbi:MAG: ABC transporter ATP-binding protein [Chloroflexi bacterium]|nr:MAG: ABC transporter ATP-binding protein [Chloroflexota bacterium]
MNQPAVDIRHLSFRYPDGHLALDDITFHVVPGEKVALVGPNGSGKSTLLLQFNGVLRAQSGEITIGGLALNEANLGQIRAWVGMAFQNPDDQLFSPRVYQDVAFGPLHMGLPEAEITARVADALEAVGLSDFAGRISFHLSVGEKKRVALATVLSMDAHILALDEPSAGLDPRARRSLVQLLKTFTHQTVIVSTHDIRLAYELCSRVVVLDGGRIVADGPAEHLLLDSILMEQHGLETP